MKSSLSVTARCRLISVVGILFATCCPPAFGFTKVGTTYTTDGSLADVQAAINDASAGNLIRIPAGNFLWGTGQTFLSINKSIILAGAGAGTGPGHTQISLATDSQQGTSGVIRILAAAVVRDFRINGATGNSITAFSTGSASGWRITSVTWVPTQNVGGYFIRINRSYGLIDSCHITGASGNNELIFGLGPTDSWQTDDSLGEWSNVFIEDCVFDGPGYVCDANENARFVVRYCTINGPMKVDGHGLASNPPRGVRQMEVYNNHWTLASNIFGGSSVGAWTAIEIRGGTGMAFNNTSTASASGNFATFFLTDYGYLGAFGGFGGAFQTLNNYPITDQIGVGRDPKAAASEPFYVWNNRRENDAPWARALKGVAQAAIDAYRIQQNNPAATFTERDIIKANRDFYADAGFDSDGTGVFRGTKAQMENFTPPQPSNLKYAFWVTDEGEWNATNGTTPDGQLYLWNGAAWVFQYRPYTYPHPLRGPTPPSNLRISTP